MKNKLETSDWLKLNNILLILENKNTIREYCNALFNNFKKIIDYNSANIFFYPRQKNLIINPLTFNISQKTMISYLEYYQNLDQIKEKFFNQPFPSKSTQLINYKSWENSEYFQDFLKPNYYYYLCGSDIHYNHQLIASLSLLRDKKSGDFTDKELIFLNYLTPHLANHLYHLLDVDKYYRWKIQFSFTNRECEVVDLVTQGMMNKEIAKKLHISISTVKKHLNHIYKKSNVSSRTQLIIKIISLRER